MASVEHKVSGLALELNRWPHNVSHTCVLVNSWEKRFHFKCKLWRETAECNFRSWNESELGR